MDVACAPLTRPCPRQVCWGRTGGSTACLRTRHACCASTRRAARASSSVRPSAAGTSGATACSPATAASTQCRCAAPRRAAARSPPPPPLPPSKPTVPVPATASVSTAALAASVLHLALASTLASTRPTPRPQVHAAQILRLSPPVPAGWRHPDLEPWAVAAHASFPRRARARAWVLVCVGWQLANAGTRFAHKEHALMDVWRGLIVPLCVNRVTL